MEANQKILYEHFKKVSVEHESDILRKRAKKAAAEILKSFPHFEKKEVKPEVKPEEKPEVRPGTNTKSKGNK